MAKRSRKHLRRDLIPTQAVPRPLRESTTGRDRTGFNPRQDVSLSPQNVQADSAQTNLALQNLLAQANSSQTQSDLIRQPAFPAAQRQALASHIGSAHGNRHLSGLIGAGFALSKDASPRLAAVQRDDSDNDDQANAAPIDQALVDALKTGLQVTAIDEYAKNLDWIDGLEQNLINQIDAAYQAPNQEAAFIALLNKDKDNRKLVAQARGSLPKKQQKNTHKLLEKVVAANPDLKQQWDQFGSQLVKKGDPKESLFERPEEGVSWEIGRTMARIDFMATMTSILGTVDAVKAHFKRVKWFTISGDSMLLYEPAGQRLELAAKEFEANYPGAQFPGTTVAQSLRGRHQHRQSLGLYAHPLGIAVDYYAYENPHLKEKAFLLETIGGGPSRLVFNDAKGNEYSLGQLRRLVSSMGKESAANLPEDQRDPKGKALLNQVDGAYKAMLQTSQNFQKSLGADAKTRLEDLAKRYWETYRGQLASASKDLAKNHKSLNAKRKKAEVKVLARLKKEHSAELKDAKKQAREGLKAQYKGKALDKQVELDPTVVGIKESMKASPDEIDTEAGVADLVKQIEAQEKQRDQLKEQITKELTDILKPFTDIIDAKMAKLKPEDKEYKKLAWLRDSLLTNFTYTFGEPEEAKNFKGSYYLRVDSPSILQLLQMGFVRYDPVPTPAAAGQAAPAQQTHGTFNAELFKTMMKYGWSPLAAAGSVDTMHFDFAEGFSLAANTGKISYGPLGVGKPVK